MPVRAFGALALALALTAGAVSVPLGAQEPKKGLPDDLRGKVLEIIKKSDQSYSVILEKSEMKVLGGQAFIVGIGADVKENYQKGLQVWVSVSDISEIVVFPSVEQYKKSTRDLDTQFRAR